MRRQSGFSMLEVLVAILVLAIGLLGMAGLTATSMRNSHGAYHRSQAVWLAYDVADRMRANRQVALAGNYNIVLGAAAPGGAAVNAVDLGQWLTAVGTLPQGLGAVAVDGATRRATITVQWNETRAAGSAANTTGPADERDDIRQFVVETQL